MATKQSSVKGGIRRSKSGIISRVKAHRRSILVGAAALGTVGAGVLGIKALIRKKAGSKNLVSPVTTTSSSTTSTNSSTTTNTSNGGRVSATVEPTYSTRNPIVTPAQRRASEYYGQASTDAEKVEAKQQIPSETKAPVGLENVKIYRTENITRKSTKRLASSSDVLYRVTKLPKRFRADGAGFNPKVKREKARRSYPPNVNS